MHMLADRLYQASVTRLGSEEHLQIAGFLREADRTVIAKDAALAVRDFVYEDPWQVECNLDLVERPTGPVWYEWPLETKAGHGGGDGATTGCLVLPYPGDEEAMAVVTGWDNGGNPRHSFAVALIDTALLANLAWGARNLYSDEREDSLARMMSVVTAGMPHGFSDEISILTDGDKDAVDAAMRDATAEMPFLMAMFVFLKAEGGLEIRSEDGRKTAILSDIPGKSLAERALDKFRRSAYKGLRRDEGKRQTRLRWFR